MSLKILAAKPWPEFKKKSGKKVLNNEWVDVRNFSSKSIPLAGVELVRLAHKAKGLPKWESVCKLSHDAGRLGARKILRIHSGRKGDTNEALMVGNSVESDIDVYTNKRSFMFNDAALGVLCLWDSRTKKVIDKVGFEVWKQEGRVHSRLDNLLYAR